MVRWHSFQNGERPEWCKIAIKTPDFKHVDTGTSLASMSCGQLQVSRKHAIKIEFVYFDFAEINVN